MIAGISSIAICGLLSSPSFAGWEGSPAQIERFDKHGQFRIADGPVPDEASDGTYSRSDRFKGSVIDTTVIVHPDRTKTLQVSIDGRQKVDCTLGARAHLKIAEVSVYPETGRLHVHATNNGARVAPLQKFLKLSTSDVLTDEEFGPPLPLVNRRRRRGLEP